MLAIEMVGWDGEIREVAVIKAEGDPFAAAVLSNRYVSDRPLTRPLH